MIWDFVMFCLGCIAGGGLTFAACAYFNYDPMAGVDQ